jgi:hypothetical protein
MGPNGSDARVSFWSHCLTGMAVAMALALVPHLASADETGESFWTPGSFGSLAATPSQPGFSLSSTWYHTSTTAGSEVARARAIRIERLEASVAESVNAISVSPEDLAMITPSYTFATPVLGGQAALALTATYGRKRTIDDLTLTTPVLVGPFAITRSRFDTVSDTVTGFGDVSPQFSLRWNTGVHNVMTYLTGNIPVGIYDRARLSNIGIGHGALDGGAGYTYLNEQTGYEFSAVAGLTYNFVNPATQYQSGIDVHLDWGASRYVTKQLQIGLVGYLYNQASCDGGSGDRVGCFQSRVASAGAQLYHPHGRARRQRERQGLQGVRRREPSGRLEPVAHLCAVTGRSRVGAFDAADTAHLREVAIMMASRRGRRLDRFCQRGPEGVGAFGAGGARRRRDQIAIAVAS